MKLERITEIKSSNLNIKNEKRREGATVQESDRAVVVRSRPRPFQCSRHLLPSTLGEVKVCQLYRTFIRQVYHSIFLPDFYTQFHFCVTIFFLFRRKGDTSAGRIGAQELNLKFAQTRKFHRFAFLVTIRMLCAFCRCQVHSRHYFASLLLLLLLLLFVVAQESVH